MDKEQLERFKGWLEGQADAANTSSEALGCNYDGWEQIGRTSAFIDVLNHLEEILKAIEEEEADDAP